MTLAPSTVEDAIEKNINTMAERLGIQVRSAWRHFDAKATADHLAQSLPSYEDSGSEKGVGQAPMPPLDNPELALVLAGVPDSLAQTSGDLYAVIVNVAVNAWVAVRLPRMSSALVGSLHLDWRSSASSLESVLSRSR
ncbi:hypothetical protein B7755_006990 [Streptomyces sp. NBS 14/10]|uniref:hypothetical protein n=1 Tax=Streptomyces sp. NBS 14/10 TaxID=1945643 RepID=UPI00211B4905|nr:hypothetical protein [Streptomyces sp. NBS 14/10]KAK1177924.1 hypothetical protein B7755_006990 [Streptomyces sp. NBS 14/10]